LTDRSALRGFRCADPADSTFDDERGFECHTAPWEFEVQEWIARLDPPLSPPDFLLLGSDDTGLAAVLCVRVQHLDRYCYIAAVGVAHRMSGRGLAGEALDRVHGLMEGYGFRGDYLVDALIDVDNSAAQSSFAGRGYVPVGREGRYERWASMF
jgi:hypothetical protein